MAIVRNGTADLLNANAVSPYTKSYTVNAASNYLVVAFLGDNSTGNNDITGVTYAGAAMTPRGSFTTGWSTTNCRFLYVYDLVSPATGANNVVISYTAGHTHYIIAVAADYGGVNTSAPTGTVVTASTPYTTGGGATSLTTNVSVGTATSWVICVQGIAQTLTSAVFGSTNLTQAISGAAFGEPTIWDSNGAVATGTFGAVTRDTHGQTSGTNFDIYTVAFALQPASNPGLAVGTYYVDNAIGNDSWDGTSQTFVSGTTGPWKSVAHATGQIFNGGSSILLNSANPAFTDGFSLSASSQGTTAAWTASAPVTFGSYGAGNAAISIGGTGVSAFSATGIAGFVLQNLTLSYSGAVNTNTAHGVSIYSATGGDFIQIKNLTVSGFGGNGISVYGGPPNLTNVTISGCVVHDCTGKYSGTNTSGIACWYCSNLHITGCTVYNNAGQTGQTAWVGSGISTNHTGGTGLTEVNGTACGVLVEYCVAYNNGANSTYAGAGPSGIFLNDAPTPAVIQFCESYSNQAGVAGADGDGFDLELCVNGIIQYCYSHDNAGIGFFNYAYSGATSSGGTIRYCISQHDATGGSGASAYYGGISISSDVASGLTNVSVYGNTVYASAAPAFTIAGSGLASITGHVSNNIFYTTGTNKLIKFGAAGNPTSFLFRGNDYYASGTFSADWSSTNYGSFSTWQSASGDSSGFSSNPLLTNPGGGGTTNGYNPGSLGAYLLQTGSPMRGAGLNLTTNFSINPGKQDYFGVGIPNVAGVGGSGYSVGADNGPAAVPPGPSPRRMLFPMLLAAGWRFGKAVTDNNVISRRRLLGRRR